MGDWWNIKIWSEGRTGKIDCFEGNTDSLLSATRIINTFRLKRGYKIVKIEIEEGWF